MDKYKGIYVAVDVKPDDDGSVAIALVDVYGNLTVEKISKNEQENQQYKEGEVLFKKKLKFKISETEKVAVLYGLFASKTSFWKNDKSVDSGIVELIEKLNKLDEKYRYIWVNAFVMSDYWNW